MRAFLGAGDMSKSSVRIVNRSLNTRWHIESLERRQLICFGDREPDQSADRAEAGCFERAAARGEGSGSGVIAPAAGYQARGWHCASDDAAQCGSVAG